VSSAFDYQPLQTTAQEQITSKGRAATLTRTIRTTTAIPVAGKAWLPTAGGDADTDAAEAQSIPVTAVFLSLDRRDRAGQVTEAKTQTVLIGAELSSNLPEQIGPDWQLVDGTKTWEILSSKPLAPGPTLMLYRMELAL
jgi:hypothetical protein